MTNDTARPRLLHAFKAEWFSISIGLLVVVAGIWFISNRWDEITNSVSLISGPRLLLGGFLTLGGVVITAECWRRWLGALAGDLQPARAYPFFFLTQATKYLPGSVWPLAVQASLAKKVDRSRTSVLAATALFLLTHLATGVVIGLLALGTEFEQWRAVLMTTSLVSLTMLTPPVLHLVTRLIRRFRQAAFPEMEITWRTAGVTTSLMLLAWALYGASTLVIIEPLGAGWAVVPTVLGAYSIGWVAGLLAVPAPAGIGAREGVFVIIAAPIVGVEAALTVAVITRVFVAVSDVLLGAMSATAVRSAQPSV